MPPKTIDVSSIKTRAEFHAYLGKLTHAQLKKVARELNKTLKKELLIDTKKSHSDLLAEIKQKISFNNDFGTLDVFKMAVKTGPLPSPKEEKKPSKAAVKKKIVENINKARSEQGLEPYKPPRKPRTTKKTTEPIVEGATGPSQKVVTTEKPPAKEKKSKKMDSDYENATRKGWPVMAPKESEIPNPIQRKKVWTVMKELTKAVDKLRQVSSVTNRDKYFEIYKKLQKLVPDGRLFERLKMASEGIDVETSEKAGLYVYGRK
jgi:hypothetical protein